jgi:autonomous glycyl radical cofactor GrcA
MGSRAHVPRRGLESVLAKAPLLNEEKLEILNLQWFLDNAPETARSEAINRISSFLEDDVVDVPALMKEVREVAKRLQEVIQARIARLSLLDPGA